MYTVIFNYINTFSIFYKRHIAKFILSVNIKMSNELVYIKDNIENTHYVYSNQLNEDYSFVKCYEWLRDRYQVKYPESIIDLRYTIRDEKCDIFCEEEFIDRGWVWNSKDFKKRTIYELSKIPLCVTVENKSVSIQTTEPIKCLQETQTDVVIYTKPLQISSFVQTNDTIENSQKSFLNKVYNQESNNIFEYFDNSANEIVTDFSNWYAKDLEPVITKISKLNLGNEGYAPNPFSPINSKNPFLSYNTTSTNLECNNIENNLEKYYSALTIELKSKLNQPNYGLRSKKYD